MVATVLKMLHCIWRGSRSRCGQI